VNILNVLYKGMQIQLFTIEINAMYNVDISVRVVRITYLFYDAENTSSKSYSIYNCYMEGYGTYFNKKLVHYSTLYDGNKKGN